MNMKPWNAMGLCAIQVETILISKSIEAKNRPYLMAYWGKAMRAHMEYIKAKGLEANVKPQVFKLVKKAEGILKAECDGKDCSFITG